MMLLWDSTRTETSAMSHLTTAAPTWPLQHPIWEGGPEDTVGVSNAQTLVASTGNGQLPSNSARDSRYPIW